MYSVKGIFSLYLFPLAEVRMKFPIVFMPPSEAGVICSIEPVDAINNLRTISTCFLFEYLTTKAFLLLSDVGRNNALFFISLKISLSFSFGIILARDSVVSQKPERSLESRKLVGHLHAETHVVRGRGGKGPDSGQDQDEGKEYLFHGLTF